MFDNPHERPSVAEPGCDRSENGSEIGNVVQGEDADDDVSRSGRKLDVFDERVHVVDPNIARPLTRTLEHARGGVDADDSPCICLGRIPTEPAVTTAEINHALPA